MSLRFEWDEIKAKRNLLQHRVAFEEAATVFADPLSLTIQDEGHSEAEDRFVTMGMSGRQRVLVVVHTDRGQRIRIISARKATAGEQKTYEEKD